jgi:hypothetical protein
MILVALHGNKFFRSQSFVEGEIEKVKETMLKDQESLEFEVMTDTDFENWLNEQ